jgi:hypothetical protein
VKLLTVQLSPFSCYFSSFGQNILLRNRKTVCFLGTTKQYLEESGLLPTVARGPFVFNVESRRNVAIY